MLELWPLDCPVPASNAPATADEAIYVQRAEINGEPLASFLVDFADLVRPAGGRLEVWMGDTPNATLFSVPYAY